MKLMPYSKAPLGVQAIGLFLCSVSQVFNLYLFIRILIVWSSANLAGLAPLLALFFISLPSAFIGINLQKSKFFIFRLLAFGIFFIYLVFFISLLPGLTIVVFGDFMGAPFFDFSFFSVSLIFLYIFSFFFSLWAILYIAIVSYWKKDI